MSEPQKINVVIGLLGTRLDEGRRNKRFERWRPTVSLCQQPDLPVARLELLHGPRHGALAGIVRGDIQQVSPTTEVRLVEITDHDPWDFQEVYTHLHAFASKYPFDPDRERYFIHITTGSHVAQICLFLLTEALYFPGVLLQTSPGAAGGIGVYSLIDLDLSRYDQIAARFKQERRQGADLLKGGIATRNQGFNDLIRRIERVATASRAPILLTGPTGAGKSRLARSIFELKKGRRQVGGSLVEVNCATIRGDGAMSTLFGHRRGAFTGALEARKGLLLAAHHGVLFLDEIGELGLDEQAMLLRAMEEKRFLPVGADQEIESDFQLIAGTNRDLSEEVRRGCFREDLLARINLWTFRLPSLAERREDIEPNLDFELERFAARQGQHVRMSREARTAFLRFAESDAALWSANFRDLSAAVTRMATLATGGRVTVEEVEEEVARLRSPWRDEMPGTTSPLGPHKTPDRSGLVVQILGAEKASGMDSFERIQLEGVLAVCRRAASLSEAGRTLFEASRMNRSTPNDADRLGKYLARHGLTWMMIKALR